MNIYIYQTCDHEKYVPILRITSLTIFEYLRHRRDDERVRYEYEAYVGLKKDGKRPHHATFNRIWRLKELAELGYEGWFLYIDADAFIRDMKFDFYEYLGSRNDKAFVFSSSNITDEFWDINAGVFMANLTHPIAKKIISEWAEYYNAYGQDDWAKAIEWNDIVNDQQSLHKILRENEAHKFSFEITRGGELFNLAGGKVIGQYLRSRVFNRELSAAESIETLDMRLSGIKNEVDAILVANNSPYRT